MSTWFTAADETRLLAAWDDAPIENLEVCGMILEVAREQVIEYAPATVPPVYEPVTLTWPDGATLALSRVGDIVTASATPTATSAGNEPLPLPANYTPAGLVDGYTFAKPGVTTAPGQTIIIIGEAGVLAPLGVAIAAFDPVTPASYRWLADPADGDGVPTRYVYAQLQQAKNLWNAGRVSSGGDVGSDGYTFTPRPLDKTIKSIIRPVDGKPDVY